MAGKYLDEVKVFEPELKVRVAPDCTLKEPPWIPVIPKAVDPDVTTKVPLLLNPEFVADIPSLIHIKKSTIIFLLWSRN